MAAFTAVSTTIEDYYLDVRGFDRVQEMLDRAKVRNADANKAIDEAHFVGHRFQLRFSGPEFVAGRVSRGRL